MQIQFSIEGVQSLSRVMTSISQNVKDWTPAFEQSGDMLIDFFSNDVFDTEGEAIDQQWSPLSMAYAKRKEKEGFGDKGILEKTGLMRSSFTKQFDATSASIWNTTEYFKYHQSKLPRTKLPRRVVMALNENLKQQVVAIFNSRLQEVLTS